MSDDSSLSLSIGAVAKATGIQPNTLRTWERRYGFPKPLRTEGGQRAYAASVVDHLLHVTQALERGLRPRDVLTADLEALRRWSSPAAPSVRPTSRDSMITWARELDAETLDRSLQMSWAREGGIAFLDEVAGPFLIEVGQARAAGELEIFQEHFAGEVLRSFLFRTWRPLADHAPGRVTVVASPPGDAHDLGLHFVATTLALCGRRLAFLGASSPIEQICNAARHTDAEAIACSFAPNSIAQEAVAQLVAGTPEGTHLLFGGRGAPAVDGAVQLTSCAALQVWALDNRLL